MWEVACFWKIHSGNPLVSFNNQNNDYCQVICPVGSGVVSSLTTVVYPCQNEICLAAYSREL